MRLGRIPWINCYPIYRAIDRGIVSAPGEMITATAAEYAPTILNMSELLVNRECRVAQRPHWQASIQKKPQDEQVALRHGVGN